MRRTWRRWRPADPGEWFALLFVVLLIVMAIWWPLSHRDAPAQPNDAGICDVSPSSC